MSFGEYDGIDEVLRLGEASKKGGWGDTYGAELRLTTLWTLRLGLLLFSLFQSG